MVLSVIKVILIRSTDTSKELIHHQADEAQSYHQFSADPWSLGISERRFSFQSTSSFHDIILLLMRDLGLHFFPK